jgi:hypothetical protein
MKKHLFFLFLILANVNLVYSQIIAGSAASGLIISNPAVSFSVTSFTSDSRTFDLDCDGIADMSVELHKGPTAIDGANFAYLHILNSIFQICADTTNSMPRKVNYFNLGVSIVPPATANWYNDANMQLGNYGCMECYGPTSVTDSYLGYKNSTTSQIGWIKISFNLIDGGVGSVPITMSVPEVLSPCVTTSITPAPTYTSSGIATCNAFTYNYAIYRPSCPGNCDGSVSITNVTGGTPAYSYFWPMGVLSPSISNVCEGAYMFNITDAVGNTCTVNFVVLDPAPMTFSLSSINVSCYGAANGTICCTNLTGGNPPYSYIWTSFGGTMLCSNNVPAALYNFVVTDANGCVATGSTIVNSPSLIYVTESITQASCLSCCDGISQLQIGGGAPPYSTVYTNTPSCPGVYGYTVTDNNGCTYVDSVLISYPTSLAEHNFESLFDVFPNPTKGTFEIKNLNSQISNAKIKVIDVFGKCVFEKTTAFQNQEIELNLTIADGIYFIHISDASGCKEFVRKIVVQK